MWQSIPARLSYFTFLFLGLFYLPWWLEAFLVLGFLVLLRNFYEAVLLGFFFDLVYGLPTGGPLRFQFIATFSLWLLVPLLQRMKKSLAWYNL